MEELEIFRRLGLALAIGLLLGFERGWQARSEPEGARVAGIRSFALTGLLGGFWGLVGLYAGDLALGVAFFSFSALVIGAYLIQFRSPDQRHRGITTEIALLLCFGLGALAVRGEMAVAAAGAVVATFLLALKPVLHTWLERVEKLELMAAIKLLLISVVLLPLLPNQGFGPGQVLNPYKLWLLVVMIAAISFVGYFAIKLAGARIGTLFTGFFGGLASSTALTVSFSRMGRTSPDLQSLLAAGVAVAAATMFARILLIVVVLNPDLLWPLAVPMGTMTVVGYLGAAVLWFTGGDQSQKTSLAIANPFELGMAVKFGVLLAIIMLLAKLLKGWFGNEGLYILAALSGIADVDAISISMAEMAGASITVEVAALSVVIAAFINTLVKGGMVAVLCGGQMAVRIGVVFTVVMLSGGVALAF